MEDITISLGVRLNDAGVKEFQKSSGASSNFSGVSKKKWGVRVLGFVLQGGRGVTFYCCCMKSRI